MAHDCRLPGNYKLMNIKMPADCFVPRLVTENAVVFADFGWVSFPWTKSQRLAI
jgi:hypothetical protein